ncbi:hypothetical protein LTS17_006626 [Exophiala oligosperma]
MPPLHSFFSDVEDAEVIEISDSDDEKILADEQTQSSLTATLKDFSPESNLSDDEILGPLTRSQSAKTYNEGDTRSTDSSDDTLEGLCEALADELYQLESPEDLALLYPRKFSTWSSLPPCTPEDDALSELITIDRQNRMNDDDGDFDEFYLEDFYVYRSPEQPSGFKGQYENLVTVQTSCKTEVFLVDGTLVHNGIRRHIRCAEISAVSFGQLEKLETSTTEYDIWINTSISAQKKYWYRLRKPVPGYREYWRDFLWVSDLSKHVLDFLKSSDNGVRLGDFEKAFWRWLSRQHGDTVSSWHAQCGKKEDLRPWLCQHRFFLWNTFYCLHSDPDVVSKHPLWKDLGLFDCRDDKRNQSKTEKSIVTPNVGAQFLRVFPRWQELQLLQVVEPCPDVRAYRHQRVREWKFPQKLSYRQNDNFSGDRISKAAYILEETRPGHHIVPPLNDLKGKLVIIQLGNTQQCELRYAFVRWTSNLSKTIKVIWAVLPSSTLCGSQKDRTEYPIGNELFFTDECNCEEIPVANVVRTVNVSAFTDHAKESEDAKLFIHTLYREKEECFITAIEDELVCHCQSRINKKIAPSRLHPVQNNIECPKMKVLSLFAGGGLWDHGFTCSGYAEIDTAIEHSEMAMLNHQANYHHSTETQYKLDSVNAVLRRILTGDEPIKHMDCLIAGCPCQGFSGLNRHPDSEGSLRNCSLLATTLSWIETFMPAYAIIENLPRMMENRSPNEGKQAVCHLVALGYQVRTKVCEVAKFGGASKRKRLIIIAAAPGAVLPVSIDETSDPRACAVTMADLPPVHNDVTINILDPYHVPISRLKVSLQDEVSLRNVVQRIPTSPSGMSLSKAYYHGHLTPSQNKWFRTLNDNHQAKNSSRYRRIDPDKPFPTICTKIAPDSSANGEMMHPFEHRTISLREAMRAMDLPKNFLLIGTVAQQYGVLGNGVPYSLGAMLGRVVGKCWRATLGRGAGRPASTRNKESQTSVQLGLSVTVPNIAPRRHKRAIVLDEEDEKSDGNVSSTSDVVFLEAKPVKKNRLQ